MGSQRLGAGAIGKHARLLCLDAAFPVAPGAVERLVQPPGMGLTQEQASHDKTGIGLARQICRLAHPSSLAGPALARLVAEVAEPARGLAGTLMGEACCVHGFTQCPLQTWVARHTQDIADVIGLTPDHARLTAKPGIAAQQVFTAEEVQQRVAVTPIVALNKAACLMTLPWRVHRIQVQPELAWRPVARLKAHLDQQTGQGIRGRRKLLVAIPRCCLGCTQCQTIERVGAGQRMAPALLAHACFAAQVLPANPSRQNAVFAQRLVLMESLITERQAVHPLCHPFGDAVFDGIGVAIGG